MRGAVRDVDHGWRQLFAAIEAARGTIHVKVGVLGDSDRGGLHKKDPATGKAAALTTAEIAAVNEFGTKDGRIPSRPAFRNTFDAQKEELLSALAKLIARMLFEPAMTVERVFDVLGMKLAAEIRKTITAGSEVPPPNALSTRRAKEAYGETKVAKRHGWGIRTLVDTGAEIGAISWAIVRGGKQSDAQYIQKNP